MKHLLTIAAVVLATSCFGQEECCATMDYNGDRNVTISDFTIFLSNYGGDEVPQASPDCIACFTSAVFDADQQGEIGLADLLIMLSLFGAVDVDADLVWDSIDECSDTSACNFYDTSASGCIYPDAIGFCGGDCAADVDADGVCDSADGCADLLACNYLSPSTTSCIYDADEDGICDDEDDCIGVIDECGVCNGPGPTELVIEAITIVYDSVFLPQLEEWYVYEIDADTTFGFTCASMFNQCGDPWSYQNYDYATVLIGEQCWFAENLRSENYANGETIASNLSVSQWLNTSAGAVAVYGQGQGISQCWSASPDGDACNEIWSLTEYGRLYNWFAVDDERGLCPSGWHVPSAGEWMELENELGGPAVAGHKMKTTYGWVDNGGGSNSSGFSGLPGGYRLTLGDDVWSDGAGFFGYWWSSTPWPEIGMLWTIQHYTQELGSSYTSETDGFSVRCIQDSE